jgi:hypothetical protein
MKKEKIEVNELNTNPSEEDQKSTKQKCIDAINEADDYLILAVKDVGDGKEQTTFSTSGDTFTIVEALIQAMKKNTSLYVMFTISQMLDSGVSMRPKPKTEPKQTSNG